MPTISSRRSEDDLKWKELRIKFALLPKLLDDGSMTWLTPYQEIWYCYKFKPEAFWDHYQYSEKLLRRNKVINNSVEEFHKIDVNELKKRLDAVE